MNNLIESANRYMNEKSDVWYHGSPDAREVEKQGGFSNRTSTIEYISDLEEYKNIQDKLATLDNTQDEYFEWLHKVSSLKKEFKLKSTIFLTDKRAVANTYADDKRAFDYQDAVPKLYAVNVNDGKNVKINATGDRFRFINVDKVKRGFIDAGVDEKEFNKVLQMFNYYGRSKKGIKTDMVAAIGQWLGFDTIDVVGVLDSYKGGTIKSTVKMVFNSKDIKIIK